MKKPLGCLPLLFPLFALLALALAEQKQKEPPLSTRPRGVPPQLTSFYQEREQFECLDGNMKISFDKANDDYCDCADGSDEPGTAACRNSKFYCPNLGYQPSTIPSSRVNDFICDCCDGSDEWDSGTQCPNICEAQGSQAREDAKRQRAVQEAGWTKRKELAKEGQKMLEERRTELERKKAEVGELETQKEAAEERKKEAERVEADAKREQDAQWEAEKKRREAAEAAALLKAADTDGDGKLSAEELKKHADIDKLNLKETTTQNIEENEEEGDGEGSVGVGKVEEFEQLLKSIFMEEEEAVPAAALDQQRLEEKLYSVRDFLTRAAEAKRKQGEEADNQEEGILSKAEEDSADASGGKPQYDEATQRVIAKADEARHEFEEVNKRVGQLQDEIRDSEQFLEFEYGADQAWAPLKGKCVELTNTQYTYKICLFDKTVQKDRGGYSEITLGYWGTWNGPEGGDKFSSQKYEHGQTCWNGPERTTEVLFECGDELELVEASEPSKCEYRFAMRAPTACRNPDELKHVEL